MPKIIVLLFLCGLHSGCYVMQAASGQWEVMRKRQAIDDVIADPATPAELTARLELLSEARDFSISELGLPDNKSYRSYADLERDYVVWNIIAAPEFSLQPKHWCFPVAGCVSYRGYFSKERAIKASERLSADGFDVAVGGVAAYSTLGNFSDPILSTMMRRGDLELVGLLFHELAHQRIYTKDDSRFNESFATVVEEIGLQRWLDSRGDSGDYADYLARREFEKQITHSIEAARQDLQAIYSGGATEAEMRDLKHTRLSLLATELDTIATAAGRPSSPWSETGLNNAHLVTTGLYEGLHSEFMALFDACEKSLAQFYEAAESLAALDKPERDRVLAAGDLRCLGGGRDD